MIKTSIVNVVATADLGQEIDLCELRRFGEIFHDSDVYGGRVAYFKSSGMEGKVSIFFSGKMISVGTKSEEKAFHELECAKEFLVERGFATAIQLQPKIRNIVMTADFGETINLEELCESSKMIYEPEQFPGGILRINEPYRTTALIFASGKAVVAGITSSDQIKSIVQKLLDVMKACK